MCQPSLVDELHAMIQSKMSAQNLSPKQQILRDFWISCNMNALDFSEFKSKTRSQIDLKDGDGITLAFLEKFMKYFANQSIGMDLSDVNFSVAN